MSGARLTAISGTVAILLGLAAPGANADQHIIPPLWGQVEAEQSSCVVCHSEIGRAFADDVHGSPRARITCVTCHGGDPANMEAGAMSHGAGFRGAPARGEMPAFCAECHANALYMRQFGLPSREFEDFQLSEHGRAWTRGDLSVALCVDCHGAHGILSHDDPRSSTYPTNIPDTCGRCHGDQKLMSAHGLPSDIPDKYRGSVHGMALLKGENKAAPSCASCHGNHAALPPAAAEIGNVCGQCHRQIVEHLRESPHAAAVRSGSLTECISCHGNHDIHPAEPALLKTVCAQCHPAGSDAAADGQRVFELITEAQAEYDDAVVTLEKLRDLGRPISELESHLEEAHTSLVRTADVQHLLSAPAVEEYTIKVGEGAREVHMAVQEMEKQLRTRKLILGMLWVAIVVVIVMLLTKRARASVALLPSPDAAHRRLTGTDAG